MVTYKNNYRSIYNKLRNSFNISNQYSFIVKQSKNVKCLPPYLYHSPQCRAIDFKGLQSRDKDRGQGLLQILKSSAQMNTSKLIYIKNPNIRKKKTLQKTNIYKLIFKRIYIYQKKNTLLLIRVMALSPFREESISDLTATSCFVLNFPLHSI